MKKFLVLFVLLFVVGCAGKYSKHYQETGTNMETEVVEDMVIPTGEESFEESALLQREDNNSVFKDVLFDFNKYDIREDARPVLNNVSSYLNIHRNLNIVIEGYCDDRGTNEYNLALGEKRARATKNYIASLGVSRERMTIMTYGEEKPLCTDQNEICWTKNRRSHSVIAKEDVLSELFQ